MYIGNLVYLVPWGFGTLEAPSDRWHCGGGLAGLRLQPQWLCDTLPPGVTCRGKKRQGPAGRGSVG